MADPVIWAAIGTGLSAVATVGGGLAQAQGMKEQAKVAQYNARMSDLKAKQISAARREELNKVLSTTQAIAGASGIDLSSSTLLNLKRQTRQDSNAAENAEVLGERVRGVNFRTEASNLRRGATFVGVTSVVQGLGQAASGFGEYKAAKGP